MLVKSVCKLCYKSYANTLTWPENKITWHDNDTDRWKKGLVLCIHKPIMSSMKIKDSIVSTSIKSIEKFCPYILEHLVANRAKEIEEHENIS